MQFYDATNGQGISQEVDRLCDTTDSTYPRIDKTARVNIANEEVATWIITADGTFQYDDDNNSTLPRFLGTLTDGQAQYSFATKLLDISSIEILNKATGGFYKLRPIDPSILGDLGWDEYFGSTSGFPLYYDKMADGIRLGPAPSANQITMTNGLRVTAQRTASLFTVTTGTSDDTTTPGFASPFHAILAYMAAIPYCMAYKPARVGAYTQKVADMKRDLLEFYSNREKDVRKQITSKQIIYR